MGYFVASMVSRPDRLAQVLAEEQDATRHLSSGQEYGWGIGFYQAGEVLHKKRPQPSQAAVDWPAEVRDLRSPCLIAHAGVVAHESVRADDTQPFRMRQWLFAHTGDLPRFDLLKDSLVEAMPDFLRRNVRGDTASEHLFHALLAFIHDAGHLDNPDAPDDIVVSALRATVGLVDRLAAEVDAPAGILNLVLTNGRQLYVLRRGAPVALREGESLTPPEPGPDTPGGLSAAPSQAREATRYVLVLSGGSLAETPVGFRQLEDASVTSVTRDLRVTPHAL